MLFLDSQSRFFRGFISRIRSFGLPIHLQAKSAAFRPLALQTQNLRGGARRGVASLRLGMGIKPSRCTSFLAALRARRIASAFSRVLRSDGFSYALRRFISRKMPSRCSFFLRALRA